VTSTRTRLAALVLLALATLTGCSGLHPGVAAEVGDQSITDTEVDGLAQDLCTTIQSQEGAAASARSSLLQYVVQSFVMRAIADQMADDSGVAPTDGYDAAVKQTKDSLAQIPKTDPEVNAHILDTLTAPQYFQDILGLVGAKDLTASGTASPSPQDSLNRGIALAQKWEADNGIQIDPRFPDLSLGKDRFTQTEDETAYAVSDIAKQASTEMAKQGSQDVDQAWVESLPASQKCG
jgi:hypothetical protein